MYDTFNRNINYLRISVTDRCNLRCSYCMPATGIPMLAHSEILTFEEIIEVAKEAASIGITKIRLTGGEPLVRRGITDLVRMLSDINGVKDLSLTTNGILLSSMAGELASAGLKRLNISLDTIDPEGFRLITRGGNLNDVLNGIDAALKAGLTPIKINCVIQNTPDEPNAIAVKQFCEEKGLQIRFIHQMDLKHGHFSIVEGGEGGNCEICNRLRLTANGKIKPCLFNDLEFDVRKLGPKEALKQAITYKPACGSVNNTNYFSNIGG